MSKSLSGKPSRAQRDILEIMNLGGCLVKGRSGPGGLPWSWDIRDRDGIHRYRVSEATINALLRNEWVQEKDSDPEHLDITPKGSAARNL